VPGRSADVQSRDDPDDAQTAAIGVDHG
jgi:hypothetical protein